jgi:hypothetical protein
MCNKFFILLIVAFFSTSSFASWVYFEPMVGQVLTGSVEGTDMDSNIHPTFGTRLGAKVKKVTAAMQFLYNSGVQVKDAGFEMGYHSWALDVGYDLDPKWKVWTGYVFSSRLHSPASDNYSLRDPTGFKVGVSYMISSYVSLNLEHYRIHYGNITRAGADRLGDDRYMQYMLLSASVPLNF